MCSAFSLVSEPLLCYFSELRFSRYSHLPVFTCTFPSDLFLNPQALPVNARALVKSTALGPALYLIRPRRGFPCLLKPILSSDLLPCLYGQVSQTHELFEDRIVSADLIFQNLTRFLVHTCAQPTYGKQTDGESCLT